MTQTEGRETQSTGRTAWRLLGCLIKTPVGCLSFLVGALVVFVIFVPPALGSLVSQQLEKWFDENYAGTLEVKEAWLLSFYGPQKIETIALRDPQQNEILHAQLTAPSLNPTLDDERWGPVQLHVSRLNLSRDAEGVTNLERAFERVRPVPPPPEPPDPETPASRASPATASPPNATSSTSAPRPSASSCASTTSAGARPTAPRWTWPTSS